MVTTTPEDNALGEALRAKMRQILERPATVRSLMELEQTSRLAREILIAGMDASSLVHRGHMHGGMAMQASNGGTPYDMALPMGAMLPSLPIGSSYAENFGAQVLRELGVANGSKDGRRSAADLVAAVAEARDRGLHDLAAKLEAELLGEGTVDVVAAKDAAPPADASHANGATP